MENEHSPYSLTQRKLFCYGIPAIGALCLPGHLSCDGSDKKNNSQANTNQGQSKRDWSKL